MLFFSPPMQFNLNAAGGAGGFPVTYWMAQAYIAGTSDHTYLADMEVDSIGNIYILSQIASATLGTASSDLDLAVTKLNPIGEFQWTKLIDANNEQDPADNSRDRGGVLGSDGDGNIFVAHTARLRGDPVNGNSTNSGFLIKLDGDGTVLWQRGIGIAPLASNTNACNTFACAVNESTGDIVVCGNRTGTGVVGTFSAFVVKYNSSGTYQWQQTFGTSGGTDMAASAGFDTNGDVLVAGYHTSGATRGVFAKLNGSTGAISWSSYLGNTTNNKQFYNIAMDGDDPVAIGFNQQNSSGSNDLWVVKFNNAGTYQWGRLLGGTGNDQGYNVLVDDSGNVYVAGVQRSDLGHTSVTAAAVLAKYDSSGTIQWQKHITADDNSVNINEITGLKFHPDGSLILAFRSGNGVDTTPGYPYPATVMKLPADDTLWPSTIGLWSIATSSLTSKTATSTNGAVSFTTNNSAITSYDSYMTVFDPSGSFTEVLTDAGI